MANPQEYFMQMQMLGQEAERLEQQMQILDQQAVELASVKESLEAIKNSEKNAEILANLGKGIFVKADLKDKELFVNIGKDVIIRKTPDETLKIIDEQTKKLSEGKQSIIEKIQELQLNMNELLQKAQQAQSSGEHKHEHSNECENGNCECQEPCGDDCECEKENNGKKGRKN